MRRAVCIGCVECIDVRCVHARTHVCCHVVPNDTTLTSVIWPQTKSNKGKVMQTMTSKHDVKDTFARASKHLVGLRGPCGLGCVGLGWGLCGG